MRWTDATLKEYLEAAVRTASALLAENYLAQDRRRLIRCMELLDEAMRAIEGGTWIAEQMPEFNSQSPDPAQVQPIRTSNLIAREPAEPLRQAG